jgi:hypothetical protein
VWTTDPKMFLQHFAIRISLIVSLYNGLQICSRKPILPFRSLIPTEVAEKA